MSTLADADKAGCAELREPDIDAVRDRNVFKKLLAKIEAKTAVVDRIAALPAPAMRG